MDKTSVLGFLAFPFSNSKDAQKSIFSKYPGSKYIEERDSFLYRGIEFDYFMSGFSLDPNKDNFYTLVDKQDCSIWVHTYGNPEQMWKQYLEYKKPIVKEKLGIWDRIKRFFYGH